MSVGSMLTFNINDGYLDAILRGYRSGILTQTDYNNLVQCDSLEDIKLHLSQTDYGDFLANEPSPLQAATISQKCTEKLVKEFNHIRLQAVAPLSTFLDYITYSYMIDNIVLIITGTLRERDTSELLEKCHPLGMFDTIATLAVTETVADLYNSVIVDTPLAPFFQECLSEKDLDEMNIEIIRNTLFKAYLTSFYNYCQKLGGDTAEVMGQLLQFEADRRAINITLNSFGTELSKDDREKLYPTFGKLYPEGINALAKADDGEQVKNAVHFYADYRQLFEDSFSSDKNLDEAFYDMEVKLNKLSFEQMFHYGIFYSYVKLKEQEIRNIVWISECVRQKQKEKIHGYIPIF